jgi:purine-binding chemotaxis protein CheW
MQEPSFLQNPPLLTEEEEEIQERIQVCVFELSDRLFALNIFDVQKIMEDAEITPIPTTPHFLRGVINLRGDIVPIVDIRDVLHLPVKPISRESRILILSIKDVRLGIFVDAIKEITSLAKKVIQPEDDKIGISDGRFISNIIQYRNSLLVLLNLDNLYQAIQL